MSSVQHLSDEAVAAFADGVLRGHARERAGRHTENCVECAHAVRVQREAVFALRAAPAPALPTTLADRLRTLPLTTPITAVPTVVADDGTVMFATVGAARGTGLLGPPMAALAPPSRVSRSLGQQPRVRREHRLNPMVTTMAVVALTGALSIGAAASQADTPVSPGTEQVVRQFEPADTAPAPVIAPVSLFRSDGH